MLRTLLPALILATATISAARSAAPLAQDKADAPKGDLAKIQGKWKASVGPDKSIPIVIEIKDKKVTINLIIQERELTLKGEIKLDESKSPREWDWTKFQNPQGEETEDNLAIYKFDGDDKLILCSGGPGNARPSKFEAGENGPPNLVELTRVKEEPKK